MSITRRDGNREALPTAAESEPPAIHPELGDQDGSWMAKWSAYMEAVGRGQAVLPEHAE
jgi:hypothetical protein